MHSLESMRTDIDQIDRIIIGLLADRFRITEVIGKYKSIHNLPTQDPERESIQFDRIRDISEQVGLNPEFATIIYRNLMDLAIQRHQEIHRELSQHPELLS